MDKTNTQAFESGEIVRRLKIQLPLAGMLVAAALLSGCDKPTPPPEKPANQAETSTATETTATTETTTTTETDTTTETSTGGNHHRGPHHHVPPKKIRKPAPRPVPPPPPPRNYKNESHKPVTPGRQPVTPPPPYKK